MLETASCIKVHISKTLKSLPDVKDCGVQNEQDLGFSLHANIHHFKLAFCSWGEIDNATSFDEETAYRWPSRIENIVDHMMLKIWNFKELSSKY